LTNVLWYSCTAAISTSAGAPCRIPLSKRYHRRHELCRIQRTLLLCVLLPKDGSLLLLHLLQGEAACGAAATGLAGFFASC
jgi:hypothetical protein